MLKYIPVNTKTPPMTVGNVKPSFKINQLNKDAPIVSPITAKETVCADTYFIEYINRAWPSRLGKIANAMNQIRSPV